MASPARGGRGVEIAPSTGYRPHRAAAYGATTNAGTVSQPRRLHGQLAARRDRASVAGYRCDGCNAEHDATPDHRLAAIDENYAGIYLRRLAAEGAAHLSSDSD
jgi:hypothetical protein